MTDDPYAMGPPPGYVPPPPPKPPPAAGPARARWLHAARQALARIGPACRCGHGPRTHVHTTRTRTDCALCDCTAYHQGSS